jgi:hypothetical protein
MLALSSVPMTIGFKSVEDWCRAIGHGSRQCEAYGYPRRGLGVTEGTRNTLAAGGFLLAAAGLGALIWSANRKEYKPKRRVLVYRGPGRQQMMTLP